MDSYPGRSFNCSCCIDHGIHDAHYWQMIQTGVKQQYLSAMGMLLFFFFCIWGYKILTPDTGKEDFFWMLIFRGVAMAYVIYTDYNFVIKHIKRKRDRGRRCIYGHDAAIGRFIWYSGYHHITWHEEICCTGAILSVT